MGKKDTEEIAKKIFEHVGYNHTTGQLFWVKSTGRKNPKGKLIIALNDSGYVCFRLFGDYIRGHRAAWLLYYGSWPSGIIDHIDGDKTNNKINNLRDCCQKGNQANRKAKGGGKYKGITKHRNKWVAQITKDYQHLYIGSYNTQEEAARAYDKMALEKFGEFARVNTYE
jgi:hypothetical protein